MAIDWNGRQIRRKLGFLGLSLAAGAAAAIYGQPLIHGNEQAVNLLVTFFSILAGFLVAIIAVIGDPGMLPAGSWRAAELGRPELMRRLARHKLLFLTYLVTLAAILLSLLLAKAHPGRTAILERIYLFLATVAFLYSLRLPWALARLQEERIDLEIQRKRKEVGLDSGRARLPVNPDSEAPTAPETSK